MIYVSDELIKNIKNTMEPTINNSNNLWTYADLARFLNLSEYTLRCYVMKRSIPFIKIGRSVRFDKKQIAEYFKIKIHREEEVQSNPISNKNTSNKDSVNKSPYFNSIKESVVWLDEQSKKYSYAEINIRIVIHEKQVRQIDRTVTEKIREK